MSTTKKTRPPKIKVCCDCHEPQSVRNFHRASKSARYADGRVPRCKACGREQAKLSTRMNRSLPRLVKLAEHWPDRQIFSEIHWLKVKIAALQQEANRRGLVVPPTDEKLLDYQVKLVTAR